jgi:predicted  nucleic acid-binding Zn-ribbon protein
MSTSAVDYYKVSRLEELTENAEDDLVDAKQEVSRAQEALEEAQALLMQEEANVAFMENRIRELKELISEAQAQIDEACVESGHRSYDSDIIDPTTGLKQGVEISIDEDD